MELMRGTAARASARRPLSRNLTLDRTGARRHRSRRSSWTPPVLQDEVAWLRHQMVNKSQQQHELEGELRDMHKQVHGKREQLRGKREQLAAAATAGQVKDEAHARLWKQVQRRGACF